MKLLTCFLLTFGFAGLCQADIHFPPAADQGPTKKLGRGISNIAFGVAEVPVTIGKVNSVEGNNAACSYGVIKGAARTLDRLQYGVREVVTFPFPTYKGKYSAPYRDATIWPSNGYTEFPPELGNPSKYPYARNER